MSVGLALCSGSSRLATRSPRHLNSFPTGRLGPSAASGRRRSTERCCVLGSSPSRLVPPVRAADGPAQSALQSRAATTGGRAVLLGPARLKLGSGLAPSGRPRAQAGGDWRPSELGRRWGGPGGLAPAAEPGPRLSGFAGGRVDGRLRPGCFGQGARQGI